MNAFKGELVQDDYCFQHYSAILLSVAAKGSFFFKCQSGDISVGEQSTNFLVGLLINAIILFIQTGTVAEHAIITTQIQSKCN